MLKTIHKQIRRSLHATATIVACVFACVVSSSFAAPMDGTDSLVEAKVVKVYPNPAVSYVNFEFAGAIDRSYTLTIYNFVGKKVTGMPVDNSTIRLSLANYYRGLYLYQLIDKGGKIIETGKFQVNQ